MTGSLILANATVVDPDGMRTGVDAIVREDTIASVEPAGAASRAGAEVVDLGGRLLIPAYSNVHHHFATGLLRGAPPLRTPTRNQRERLEQVVWPFERRLTPEDVRVAVQLALLEAIAAGTTTVIDHHVGSGCIPGILDLIAAEVAASGLRAVLCYEITDRDGPDIAATGLAENERFLQRIAQNISVVDASATPDGSPLPRLGRVPSGWRPGTPWVAVRAIRPMVGLHAMSTIGPETLARATDLAQRFGVGLHLHLGESVHDNVDSVARYGGRPVARLDAVGALSPLTLAAHVIHVTDDEIALLGERGVMVAHNPRSNASNGVGVTDLGRLRKAGLTVGVGGDGFTQDIRTELDLIPLLQRQHRADPTLLPPPAVIDLGVTGNAEIVERVGGWTTGRVAPGYLADLVALDFEPVVPLRAHNALWHYARGFPDGRLRDVWAGGRPVLRDGTFLTLDAERIRHAAGLRFEAVWNA